ncbi:MAG: IS21 family transposase [Erysipelothrix sp.]|nr:IS21 family transposase [Erysipelothrix sp.]
MTKILIEHIRKLEDLLMFSKAYQKGMIQLNITKIAKHLKKDRKTVRKYLMGEVPKKTRQRQKYLDEHREYIVEVLSDKYQSFDYIDHLFKYLKREKGITCNRSTLNRYIRNDDELNGLFNRKKENSFTERFETKPGQQAQFDIKERVKTITETGEVFTTYIPTLTLSWSRYNVRRLTLDIKAETLLSFLAESFEEIGGVPKELVIDNLKAFVETPRRQGQDAQLTKAFSEFTKNYNIQIKPCMPNRPQTKGKTETQNKIVSQLKNYNGMYKDLIDIHDKLSTISKEDNVSISQATKFPRIFLLEKEKGDLLPLPRKEIRQKYHLNLKEVTVSNESFISYKSNKYSVDKKFIGHRVGLVVKRDELHIYYNNKIILPTILLKNHILVIFGAP